MNVVLIGMPGAGKSETGALLARLTGRRFIDTDRAIEERHGRIPEIFSRCGEAHFREIEAALAKELSKEDGLIISTGGGMLLKRESLEALKENGIFVYLRAKPETLLMRVGTDDKRPLLRGAAKDKRLRELLKERAPIYEAAADHIIDTDGKSMEETATLIIKLAVKEGK